MANPFKPRGPGAEVFGWFSDLIDEATGVNPHDDVASTVEGIIDPSAGDRARDAANAQSGIDAAGALQGAVAPQWKEVLNPETGKMEMQYVPPAFDTAGLMSEEDLEFYDYNEELQVTPQMLMNPATLSNPYLMENAYNINAPDKTQSAWQTTGRDPLGMLGMQRSMSYFDNISKGGQDAAAEAEFRSRLEQANQSAEAQRLADLQSLETRGMSGGGMELLSSLQAGQDQLQSGALASLQATGMQQQRRDSAGRALGDLGSQYWGQASSDYSDKATALDDWSQYWTDLGVDVDKYNADASRDTSMYNKDASRDTDMFNVGERNDASEYNAGVHYDARDRNLTRDDELKDKNVEMKNELAAWNNGGNQRMFDNWINATGVYTGATKKGPSQYPDYLKAGADILPFLGGMG